MMEGKWMRDGVLKMGEFDPDPFMEELKVQGLPWIVEEL
jgi:saccharopine dehydrogenase (NAD+, L-lysine-forming)